MPPPKYHRLFPGNEVAAARCLPRQVHGASSRTTPGDVVELALHLRPGLARRIVPRRPEGEEHHPLDRRRRTPFPRRCGCTTSLFTAENPDDESEDATGGTHLNPELARRDRTARGSPGVDRAACRRERPCSSSAWGTSAWIRTRRPGAPVFNRTITLKDSWAKIERPSARLRRLERTGQVRAEPDRIPPRGRRADGDLQLAVRETPRRRRSCCASRTPTPLRSSEEVVRAILDGMSWLGHELRRAAGLPDAKPRAARRRRDAAPRLRQGVSLLLLRGDAERGARPPRRKPAAATSTRGAACRSRARTRMRARAGGAPFVVRLEVPSGVDERGTTRSTGRRSFRQRASSRT